MGVFEFEIGGILLTDTEIRKAKVKALAYRMPDGRGLYLMITPAGGKLWRWKYRRGGAEKLMSFGQYPDLSLADARERHEAARKLLASGADPMEKRKADKLASAIGDTSRFRTVALLWHEHWKVDKSERHVGNHAPPVRGQRVPGAWGESYLRN